MRAGSIYYHFDSKEQILQEVLDIGTQRVFDAVVQAIEAMPPGARPRDKIRVGIEAHLRSLLLHGAYTSVGIRIFGQVPKNVQRRNQRLRDDYGDYWRELLRQAREAGEISPHSNLSLVRMFLFGALNWSVEWFKPGQGPLTDLADEIWAILFHGAAERPGVPEGDEEAG
jgi:AcrR family transcriptional regulator